MNRCHNVLTLALVTTLVASTASAAPGDRATLRLDDENYYDAGQAGEIYAELDMENWLPEPSTTVGKATVQLWNRSDTPSVSYLVNITLQCTGRSTTESKTGSLSNGDTGHAHTVRCKDGNVISATARILRL